MPIRPFALVALFSFVLLPLSAWSQAQPKQPTLPLKIGKETVVAEVVYTPETMQRGLMFREELGTNEGMLFIYAKPRQMTFWMKNTSLPLSIAYIDSQGVISEIRDMEPFNESTIDSKSDQIQFALEMNRDWFDSHNIKPGTKVEGLSKLKF